MAERDKFEKVTVNVPPGLSDGFHEAALKAGWSDDPGTGKSIYIKDRSHPNYGSEIPNPQPMAPPVGYEPGDTLEEMVRRHMQRTFNLMRGEEPIDETPEDLDDFDVPDELPDLESIYEVREMEEEVPALRPAPPPDKLPDKVPDKEPEKPA